MFDLFDPVVGIQSSSQVWRAVSDPRSVKALDVAGTPGAPGASSSQDRSRQVTSHDRSSRSRKWRSGKSVFNPKHLLKKSALDFWNPTTFFNIKLNMFETRVKHLLHFSTMI